MTKMATIDLVFQTDTANAFGFTHPDDRVSPLQELLWIPQAQVQNKDEVSLTVEGDVCSVILPVWLIEAKELDEWAKEYEDDKHD